MTQIEIIVEPGKLFELINQVSEKYNLNIIFRRFKNKSHGDGWKAVPAGASTLKMYQDFDGYEIYLCEGMIPRDEKDTTFTKEAAKHLIIISGGLQVKNDLELTVIRIFHKESTLKKVFAWLKKTITQTLKREEIYLDGHPYNTIWFDDAVWKYKVYYNINGKKIPIKKESAEN